MLPSVDQLLNTEAARSLGDPSGSARVARLAREVLASLRRRLLEGDGAKPGPSLSREMLLEEAASRLKSRWASEQGRRLRRVINATGVVIHTNLGRAPLSNAARTALLEAAGWCNLEYDLQAGKRGRRAPRAEDLLCELTGAEAAAVVNNGAAAALLVLSVLAPGREVIVSRGELVEIGGDFRVPDVLSRSGATLREVGTTNRTKLLDYEAAINENTGLILRVHPSNYKIIGFTESPALGDLAELAHSRGLLLYEDAGSGALVDLSGIGLSDEPVVSRSVAEGADIVSFSGDKLLGGPQAGAIVGGKDVIERIRKHPLYRALRVDKLVNTALEATLEHYARGTAFEEVPVLQMLSMTRNELAKRTKRFVKAFRRRMGDNASLNFEITDGFSVVGGGAAPGVQLPTLLISIAHGSLSAPDIEKALRASEPPVIARIEDDKVFLDLRTVRKDEEAELLEVLCGFAAGATRYDGQNPA